MSEKPPDVPNPFDPAAWRQGRDAYLEAWARMMVEAVNTDAYAKATGTTLDSYLTAASPFREAFEKSMIHALEQLSMPTRADVVSLAERMTNLEMRLDDMDAKLDRIEKIALELRPAFAEASARRAHTQPAAEASARHAPTQATSRVSARQASGPSKRKRGNK